MVSCSTTNNLGENRACFGRLWHPPGLYSSFLIRNSLRRDFFASNLLLPDLRSLKTEYNFTFGNYPSRVLIRDGLPSLRELAGESAPGDPVLVVCDTNTEGLARKILGETADTGKIHLLVLPEGEKSKTWESVEAILRAGRAAGLGRDGVFIGLGGGVIGDLTGFAASIYMRGARLCLVSTTLLAMTDASLGGKTGIDLLGLKNLAGSFYPAGLVFMPLAALDSLPEREWKSGMAELIKTAVLDSQEFLDLIKSSLSFQEGGRNSPDYKESLKECISRAVAYKGSIVEEDPRETGTKRALLNLGHTFGHALEAAAGLGVVTHGEAVAWGIARACELGTALDITPPERTREITEILVSWGYETRAPYPLVNSVNRVNSTDMLISAMLGDKKRTAGKFRFVVPGAESARIISATDTPALEGSRGDSLLRKILNGEYQI